MKVLGIHDGHNASAVLCEGGRILAGIQEERIRYEKNWTGFPSASVRWLLEWADCEASDIDRIAFNGHHMPAVLTREELVLAHKIPWTMPTRTKSWLKRTPVGDWYTRRRKRERIAEAAAVGFSDNQIVFVEHHQCHAAAAYYGWGRLDRPVLVLTCDGAGDRLCATVNIGEAGRLRRVAAVRETESIGSLYACITTLMGFMPLEHEYKLMGMAPYADDAHARRVAERFRSKFRFVGPDGRGWKRTGKCPPPYYGYWYWRDELEGERFDNVMGGLQVFTEEFLTEWVRHCVRSTGIEEVALGGGVFMNVKANKMISEIPEVRDLFVFPSCGDETNPVGACLTLESEQGGCAEPTSVENVYWGPDFEVGELEAAVRVADLPRGVDVRRSDAPEDDVAKLLADGAIVARFSGREEMGARALGNRSILADPTRSEVVHDINQMIKKRDFWMPFASSIKSERAQDYLVNPKGIDAPFMILTFDTTPEGREDLRGGMHPTDGTIRPQVVRRSSNPAYWKLLDAFEAKTGRGGLLNTSFNLHGYPIVHSPHRAMEVFLRSGLTHLQLGRLILSKRNGDSREAPAT